MGVLSRSPSLFEISIFYCRKVIQNIIAAETSLPPKRHCGLDPQSHYRRPVIAADSSLRA
jgi:hypothetical protein